MIREKALFCKLFHKNISSADRFARYMASYRPELETCPCCQCRGKCKIHSYYNRYIIDFRNGMPCVATIRVMRVVCECGHTHAILPDFIVPYRQLSLHCMLQILIAYYVRHLTVERICRRFGVSAAAVYRLKKLYEEHKHLWLGALKDEAGNALPFLRSLCQKPEITGFLHDFYRRTSFSFLQNHKNPTANSDGCELRKKQFFR